MTNLVSGAGTVLSLILLMKTSIRKQCITNDKDDVMIRLLNRKVLKNVEKNWWYPSLSEFIRYLIVKLAAQFRNVMLFRCCKQLSASLNQWVLSNLQHKFRKMLVSMTVDTCQLSNCVGCFIGQVTQVALTTQFNCETRV